ncbi:MAG: ABC transporter substrate-binding protein [Proteobacteria bacterium]|nr:ABC transporter substrate-binding protein [Pseudomonadota bacterium]
MMVKLRICTTFVASLMLMSLFPLLSVAAQDQCVRVLGYESDGEKQSMDPAELLGTDNTYHIQAVYEPLVDRDSAMQPYPVLANSWESNSDGTVWTFYLRQGVTFHDGTAFDSGDVVYSIQRILDPNISPGGSQVFGFLTGAKIEAIDTYTVRITLPQPVVELPLLIATKYSMIVPEGAQAEDLRVHGVGTGPFMQEEFTINGPVRILRRNPNYWQAGLPIAECLEIRVITESMSRAAAIMNGEADLALVVDPVTLTTLGDNSDVNLISTSGATALFLAMWTDTPPFDDVRVRTAMKLVVDREAIVETVLLGYGEPGNDVPIPPSSPNAYRSDIKVQDIGKAKELLAEAGYPNGLDVDLYTSDSFSGMKLLAEVYAEMAKEAGIRVNVVNTPVEGYWDTIWLKYPLVISYMAARPPGEALANTYLTTSPWNETHWYSDEYDALLNQANATVDPVQRRELYQEAQRIISEDGGNVLPAFAVTVSALRKGCSGFQPHVDVNRIDYRHLQCD